MILSDLFYIGAVEIRDKDLLAFSLEDRVCDFRIVDPSLSSNLKNDLLRHPVDNVSKVLEVAFILFTDEVFPLDQIKKMKFQLEGETVRFQNGFTAQ